nr:FAD-dependent oxidoreductase [Cellulosimicrobium sp. MM]
MYSRSQAMKIRDTLFIRLEKAAANPGKDEGLRVVVVGGGATGVEVAGALAELRTAGLRPAYPEIHGDAFEVKIVQRGGEVLKSFHPKLRRYAAEELRRRGVGLHLGAGVAEVLPDAVVLTDGTRIRSDLTVWSAGVHPHEEVDDWGLPRGEGGRVVVGDDLQVEGLPGVFAAGDIAISPAGLPQLAQPAIQSGEQVARNIEALLAGRPRRPCGTSTRAPWRSSAGARPSPRSSGGCGSRAASRGSRGCSSTSWGLIGPRNRLTTLAGCHRYGSRSTVGPSRSSATCRPSGRRSAPAPGAPDARRQPARGPTGHPSRTLDHASSFRGQPGAVQWQDV